MSDDEEYYEFEEDYMYEDLGPDIVDDLAASSYYEAGLYDDPAIDVEDDFSDWDYYSDDYYDEDATAEQSAERKKRSGSAATANPRTKPSVRTAQPPAIVSSKSSVVPDIASFQGVVWKTPALDRDQDVAILYEPDTGDKVALLENWREVFKSAQPALDKSRLKRRRVEESRPAGLSPTDDDMSADECADDASDKSDGVSDVSSLDTSGVDAGGSSNTTTDPEPDSVRPLKLASPPKVVIPLKRGQKRKAAVRQDEADEAAPPRSKRVASGRGGRRGTEEHSAPPVRRSTRQKK